MIGFARFDPEAFRRRLKGYSDLEFDAEFQRFLQPHTGRAWRTRMDAYDHMTEHNLVFNQKNFEIAAIAVADEISVTLFHEDIGSAWTSNTIIHDGGGNRAEQVRPGSEGGNLVGD